MSTSESGQRQYSAFISYSRKDRAIAIELQHKLEQYVLPRALRLVRQGVRREAKPLKPVFRDEHELVPGQDLRSRIRAGLEGSEYLVVVCSPAAAASQWVEREILEFHGLGKGDNILAIVVDGQPHAAANGSAPELECLPRALRFEVEQGAAGARTTDRPTEPLWVDWRPSARSDRGMFLRVVAALLSLSSFDELVRRDALARRRQTLQRSFAATVSAAVLVGGGAFIYLQADRAAISKSATLLDAAQKAENAGDDESGARLALIALRYHASPAAETALLRAVVENRALGPPVDARHEGTLTALAFEPNGLAFLSGSKDGQLRRWDARTGANLGGPLQVRAGAIASIIFSPDGKYFATLSDLRRVDLWDRATHAVFGSPITLPEKDSSSVCLGFSADSTRLMIAVFDSSVETWSVLNQAPAGRLPIQAADDQSCAISADGKSIVGNLLPDGPEGYWTLSSGARLLNKLPIDGTGIVWLSPDGARVAATNTDVGLTFNGEAVAGAGRVNLLAFARNNSIVASANDADEIRFWADEMKTNIGRPIRFGTHKVSQIDLSPDGSILAVTYDAGVIRRWRSEVDQADPSTNCPPGLLAAGTATYGQEFIDSQCAMAIGRAQGDNDWHLAALSGDRSEGVLRDDPRYDRTWLSGWDFAAGRARGAPIDIGGAAASIATMGDGEKVAVGTDDGRVLLWTPATGKVQTLVAAAPHSAVDTLAMSRDGRYVAICRWNGALSIFDLANNRLVRTQAKLADHRVGASVAFSKDGSRLASVVNADVSVWDSKSGSLISHNTTQYANGASVVFSPDGRRIAISNGGVGVLDTESGEFIRNFSTSADLVVFSSDSKTLYSMDVVGGIHSWPVDRILNLRGRALVDIACAETVPGVLSRLDDTDLEAAPILDRNLDADACRSPSWWQGLLERLASLHTSGARPT